MENLKVWTLIVEKVVNVRALNLGTRECLGRQSLRKTHSQCAH
jgi:hypothetical protein